MTIFQEIEKRLEGLFEGFFSRQFRSSLHPVELAKKLAKEMDRSKTIGVERVYVPNSYQVALSSEDFEKLAAFQDPLAGELKSYLRAHAEAKGYQIPAGLTITFTADDTLGLGVADIEAHLVEREETPEPEAESGAKAMASGHTQVISPEEAAELGLYASNREAVLIQLENGKRYPLQGQTISIGRQAGNDLVIEDPSVSRRHALLEREGPTYVVTDLKSTNGTLINQIPVTKAVLEDEDCLTLGKTNFIFRS